MPLMPPNAISSVLELSLMSKLSGLLGSSTAPRKGFTRLCTDSATDRSTCLGGLRARATGTEAYHYGPGSLARFTVRPEASRPMILGTRR